jgi:hypothetical protein
MTDGGATHQLERFALGYRDDEIEVRRAIAALDDRRDGEPVTRVTLLVTDPTAETWEIDRVRELRHALSHRAAELGLPAVSLTLVPESEAEVIEAFAQ